MLALLLIACASDWEPTAALVTATSPPDGATNVRVDPLLRVTFDEVMAPAEPSGILLLDEAGQALPMSETWDEQPWGITLQPAAELEPGSSYTLLVPSTLRAADGSQLLGDVEASFTVLTEELGDSG